MYSFIDLITYVLNLEKIPLTAEEIWNIGLDKGLAQKIGTKGKTPIKTLAARLYTDMKNNPKSDFIKVGKRPTKFFLKSLGDIKEEVVVKKEEEKFCERDLDTFLVKFIFSNPNFKAYSKTIYHEASTRKQKGYNKWLHPDIVGVYFPFEDYNKETQSLQKTFKVNPFKLFSFEMKIKLTLSTLRECYFQAVSNSSWANEGYLVALEIDEDEDLMDELRRLKNSFGIGVIKLNREEVEASEILLPGREKEFLDWDTIDRLTDENRYFKKFINSIMEDIKLRKVKSKYDEIIIDK